MNFLLHQIHGGLHWNLQKFKHLNLRLNSKALLWTFGSFTDASGISGLKLVWDDAGQRGSARVVRIRHHAWSSCVQVLQQQQRAGRIRYSVLPMLDAKPAPAYFKTLLSFFPETIGNVSMIYEEKQCKFHALNFGTRKKIRESLFTF